VSLTSRIAPQSRVIATKTQIIGGDWVKRRLKAIRFWLIKVSGWVSEKTPRLAVRLVGPVEIPPALDL